MPWCDGCDRFYNPNTVPADGRCPGCGAQLDRPTRLERQMAAREASGGGTERVEGAEAGDGGDAAGKGGRAAVPWHFWLLIVALVIYLGWRLVQLIGWLVG